MSAGKMKMWMIGAGILAVGILGMVLMIALRPEPPKSEPTRVAPLVVTVSPTEQSGPLMIRGNGSVQPVREIDVAAEVSGKITSVSEAFVNGGTFQSGDVLLEIDPSDYRNAVAIAEAEVTQRKFDVLTAEEEVLLAEEEWERLKSRRADAAELPDSTDLGILVLKQPQLAAARANLQSAEARLADARKQLERTRIRAPFNGIVRAKSVDLGQFISPGQIVGRIYSTDAVEITVPLSSEAASLVDGLWSRNGNGSSAHSKALVTTSLAGREFSYDGYVHRIEGAVDAATRTIGLVVRVDDAYVSAPDQPPLFVGKFASVSLEGITPDRYFAIPRSALREGNVVWTVEQGRLAIVPVEILQEADELAYVVSAFDASTQVVNSSLGLVVDGMEVRVAE